MHSYLFFMLLNKAQRAAGAFILGTLAVAGAFNHTAAEANSDLFKKVSLDTDGSNPDHANQSKGQVLVVSGSGFNNDLGSLDYALEQLGETFKVSHIEYGSSDSARIYIDGEVVTKEGAPYIFDDITSAYVVNDIRRLAAASRGRFDSVIKPGADLPQLIAAR